MKNITAYKNPNSPITEAYRNIRTNLEFSNIDKEIKTIVVTSSKQNEGKTTVVSNLGVSFAALENKKILILDADLRNPSVHRAFDISNTNGLTDVLKGSKTYAECVKKTKIENLHVLTTGTMPPNPSELLNSNKMRSFVEELKSHYDYIFIDTPPIAIVTDASVVSTYADGVIMVVGAKEVDVDMAKIAKERLDKVNANILGAIMNKYSADNGSYGYYNYYYEQQDTSRRGRRNKKKRLK